MTQIAYSYNKSVGSLAAMPPRIRRLPISEKGFPVPWFVTFFDSKGEPCPTGEGTPDFRVFDTRKMKLAIDHNLCTICGEPLGVWKCFVIGPMCAITRTISEPPSHRECSVFSAQSCPFLTNPRMVRNEKGMIEEGQLRDGLVEAAGIPLQRNPGVCCVWVTKSFRMFRPHQGRPGVLFSIGRPEQVVWYCEGRRATRAEVMASIDSGYPTLEQIARQEGPDALAALQTQREVAMATVPD
jgi:hypothetical protein